ncbi:protein ROLLING AND ERECT LEAF 2-like [Cornus florida]|uniref:protein ROLLING AND ERECT LEAF 2-like n=1 Tax=Cornus florida TaxID=4283 RepID=UPI0028A13135|nr:protein ROLLING AND ERECT LEAF 2-like [Cornus florida]
MGCTQSKIENEETVTRCKDRKRFMKDAVSARNAFAAAHSGYTMALKNTGAALSDYAHGEVQPSQFPASATGSPLPGSVVPHTYDTLPPPPPPLNFSSPLQRAATMPEFVIPEPDLKHSDPIIEVDNEDEVENESHNLRHRTTRSSGGGGRSGISSRDVEDEGLPAPPSPPRTPLQSDDRTPLPPPPPDSTWDFFFPPVENMPGSTLEEVEESRVEREEPARKVFEERAKRVEDDGGDGGGRTSGKAEAEAVKAELPPQPSQSGKLVKKVKHVAPAEGKRPGKGTSNVNLVQIFGELDDCFLKASESAHEVSKMLEANRLHYHSNFADNRGHIDHSARVMRVITWNRSFRGFSNAEDGKDDFDSEEQETHATVLDKMLAWEKKLYDEVKAGEQMKLEYQRKVASLNKIKKRGTNTEALEKTKATVSHLHTRYIVDMQSMDSTVSEINRLRDEQLYPKLVALVDGMATMWETMRGEHDTQSKIVTALRSLDISQSPKETSEHHHERTLQLLHVVEAWHSHLAKLMTHQKEYIKALNSWLKLNLIPIDNNLKEKVSSPQRPQNPPIQTLLRTWNDYLEKLPDEHARTAIHNFAAVIHNIVQFQEDEMKLKYKCEDTQKELNRKKRQYEDWYNKYLQRRTPPDGMDPDRALDDEVVAEKQLQVDIVEKRLEEEVEAYKKQCVQVREKSYATLKTRFPELFRAMSDFSVACSDMYGHLRSVSPPHNLN